MNSITSYSPSDTFKDFDDDKKGKYTCCNKTVCRLLCSPLALGFEIYERFPSFESFSQFWSGSVLTYELYSKETFKEPDYSLKWDELVKIQSSGFSLRHVSKNERGYKEMKEGFNGDSVCLSQGVSGIIYKLFQEKKICEKNLGSLFLEIMNDSHSVNEMFSYVIECLSEDEKQLVVKEFELAIWKFLNFSIFAVDNRLDKGILTMEYITERMKNLENTSTFLVIEEKGPKRAYDQDRYFCLGKGGKRQVSSKDVKKVITISGEAMRYSIENSNSTNLLKLLELIDKAAITSIHQQVISFIK